jgi:Xaa-Pro dipeptidase
VVIELKERIKKIFSFLEEKPDLILIQNPYEPYIEHNFFYVTCLEKGIFEGCSAILYPDGNMELIVSELESQTALNVKADVKIYENKHEYKSFIKESIGMVDTIGLNYDGISFSDFLKIQKMLPDANFNNVSKSLMKARAIKDKNEINLIKKAAIIVDKVVEKIPDVLNKVTREYELAAEIDYFMQKNGADKAGFETISSFGKNSSEPHYSHGDTLLKNGDFVLCDFGARFKRYNSDITRTFVFGKASSLQKKMHKVVLDAQNIAFQKIKSGVKGKDVHNLVYDFINNSEFKNCFVHSTGHPLGLAVHDVGVGLNAGEENLLEENMVLTVEPGIYVPGLGGVRIEDDIIVKKDGLEILTKSCRNLIEV